MWKIQQAKQDDAIRAEVFIRQNFSARIPGSRLEKPRSQKPRPPGQLDQVGKPGSCEEALKVDKIARAIRQILCFFEG